MLEIYTRLLRPRWEGSFYFTSLCPHPSVLSGLNSRCSCLFFYPNSLFVFEKPSLVFFHFDYCDRDCCANIGVSCDPVCLLLPMHILNCIATVFSNQYSCSTMSSISLFNYATFFPKRAILSPIVVSLASTFLSLSLLGVRLLVRSSRTADSRKRQSSSILFYSRCSSMLWSLRNTRSTDDWMRLCRCCCSWWISSIRRGESMRSFASHSRMGLCAPFSRRERICSLVLRNAETRSILWSNSSSLGEVRRCSRVMMSSSTAEWQFWICWRMGERFLASSCSINSSTRFIIQIRMGNCE